MASIGEEENVLQENSGRRTRSSRRVSGTQPVSSPVPRSTRRSKKQEQLTEQEELVHESTTDAEQTNIIQEMLAEAAQGNLMDSAGAQENASPSHQGGQEQEIIEEDIVEEIISTEGDECVVYEEQVIEEIYENVHEENHENIAANSDANLDEKSSSFPFATEEVGQSETSEDLNEQRESKEENNEAENQGTQENSLLASLVGDNANSLPSVGCGAESEKEHFESKVLEENCEKLDSEDSLSEPAIAEDAPIASGSDDTMVNTEVISEDELPPPTKPEINDAEEVSDEELPAPQRAELPADAEVISEDELPVTSTLGEDQKDSPTGKKRKAELPPDAEVISEDELPAGEKQSPSSVKSVEQAGGASNKKRKAELPSDAEVISEDELPVSSAVGEKHDHSPSGNDEHTESSSSRKKRKAESRGASSEKKLEGNSSKKDEQYNPMSPTSESNDSTPMEKKAKLEESEHKEKRKDKEREKDKDGSSSSSTKEKDKEREKDKDKEKERKKLPDLDKYWRAVKDDPADFTGWTYLLQYVDNESDAEAAREAYDAFLSHYPYCYGYWRKYADYEKRKGIKANCNAVFERGLEAIPLSVDLWIHYLAHVKSNHSDDEDYIRSQFERAVESCGLEFRSDKLWDAYLKWENEGKRYQNMVKIYDRLIAIPTQGYSGHFDNFQDLINQHSITSTITAEEIKKIRTELKESASATKSRSKSKRGSSKDKDTETKDKDKEKEKEKDKDKDKESDSDKDKENPDKVSNDEVTDNESNVEAMVTEEDSKTPKPTEDLGDLTTLTEEEIHAIKDKIISLRRKIHKSTVSAITARWTFEEGIKRPYFHVKPLERCQLKNWKDYLDFEIEKGDRKRILVLFERCLIACALYDEFWLKMIRYLETIIDQPGIPAIASDVYRRACEIHHPDKPSLHLMWAAFEECQNNFDRAAEILVNLEKRVPNLLQVAYRRINVERRRGDYEKCKTLYEHYINTAKNKNIAGSLAIKYARFLNKICQDLEGGLKVLRQALDKDSANTRVALQMIDLALQRTTVDEDEVVLIMDKFMARENIEPEQKVLFAQRKVEFLEDFGSSAKGLQDAQRALQLALNKANEAKKKRENSPSRKSGHKDASSISTSTQSAYNNGSSAATSGYNYGSGSSAAYYGQQNSGSSGSYPQQQQSYDSYYNHWQYNTGYSGYGQWSGYSNYY
ncbi:pre-mRNA-processing factor 39 [Lucilia sericata]|uniref:pre-mRNA-processing factor 39 n=1 Tax=Lucilia sericata TaxID=13632 RepID=UPI0018A83925|nr:pre-mRNA-processing factor 39 [Lucilia sericata]